MMELFICLPSAYSCIGITYNKTLLEKHGWKLPKSFHDLEKLAKKGEKKQGVQLCLTQIEYPGYGFQYMCNIADTAFFRYIPRQAMAERLSDRKG